MIASTAVAALRLVRIPGEFGPILRCLGELNWSTTEVLRRELDLLEPLDHPALTLNLSGCDRVDSEAILTILYSFKRLRQRGSHLLVVARAGRVARRLEKVRFHWVAPVFSTEEAAALAFRGGPSSAAPPTWGAALAETVVHWYQIEQALDGERRNEAVRLLTSMTPLCERSEELFRGGSMPANSRCEFCPLFYERGVQLEDVGCASMLDPIIAAVHAGSDSTARAQVAAVVRTIEEILLIETGALSGAVTGLGPGYTARRRHGGSITAEARAGL